MCAQSHQGTLPLNLELIVVEVVNLKHMGANRQRMYIVTVTLWANKFVQFSMTLDLGLLDLSSSRE